MITEPDLVDYVCIAKGAIILAEFNPKDAALGEIAAKCLEKTPPFHATFTHTVRSKAYTFLINEPYVYFAIFDEKLEKSDGLAFLKSVRDAFDGASKEHKDLDRLSSHCFQGEFNPVFRQLLGSDLDHLELVGSPSGQRIDPSAMSPDSNWGSPKLNGEKGMQMIKNREHSTGKRNGEKKENDENGVGLSRDFSLTMQKNGDLYSAQVKAKKVWKKQVWIVLSLDLIICVIMFAVWLLVCNGFKCIKN